MRFALSAALLFVCSALTIRSADSKAEWMDLMNKDVYKAVDPEWITTESVSLDAEKNGGKLKAVPVPSGTTWVNGVTGRIKNLYTKQSFGDCELHLEFLVAKGSNAGVKFHGMYEIQILDSFGKTKLSGDSCGGIYPRAEAKPRYHHIDDGIAPKVNGAKPPGEWQTLDVVWRSPRFDDKNEKIENARVVKATLNGQVIHDNQELKTHTGDNWSKKEIASGPLMIQADHGPFAFRNLKVKPLTDAK